MCFTEWSLAKIPLWWSLLIHTANFVNMQRLAKTLGTIRFSLIHISYNIIYSPYPPIICQYSSDLVDLYQRQCLLVCLWVKLEAAISSWVYKLLFDLHAVFIISFFLSWQAQMSRTLNLDKSEALDSSVRKKDDILCRSLRSFKVILFDI